MTGGHRGEDRVGLSNRKLARKKTIADEHPDMIDPEPGQRGGFFRSFDLEDLHQHVAHPTSEEIMGIP